jgi:hypothetical protein
MTQLQCSQCLQSLQQQLQSPSPQQQLQSPSLQQC